MTCQVCQAPLLTRHYLLACQITKMGDGPTMAAATDGSERLCSSRCALMRLSRLVDDANGARLQVALLTAAAHARVQRATIPRGGAAA